MVSDEKHGIACHGWIDGDPVHFLTSADGTPTNEVTRRIGRRDKKVNVPNCMKRHNHGTCKQWTGMIKCDKHFLLQVGMVSRSTALKLFWV
jgi:hypothetical protein